MIRIKPPVFQHVLQVRDLPAGREHQFDLQPAADTLSDIAQALDLLELRKLRFQGVLRPSGKKDWELEATLGATVVQPCVVTLEPVVSRIDDQLRRHYVADFEPAPPQNESEAAEIEMPEDDTVEALRPEIDLGATLLEALALALPLYPRSDGADHVETQFSGPGIRPMSDEDARPFAGLSSLRDKLKKRTVRTGGETPSIRGKEKACAARESQYVPGFVYITGCSGVSQRRQSGPTAGKSGAYI